MLSDLAKSESVTYHINEKAFDKPGSLDPDKTFIAEFVIPPMKGRLATVLDVILERVPAKFGAIYLIRKDWIEITSQAAREEVWGKDYRGPFLPLVNVTANHWALDDLLKDVALHSGKNITVDLATGDRGRTPVTTRFLNEPLDTALFLLTDMAGLTFVQLDSAFHVTTAERAEELKAAWAKRRPRE